MIELFIILLIMFLAIRHIYNINYGDENYLDKDKGKVKKSEEDNKKSSKHGFALEEKQVQNVTAKMKKDLEDDLFGWFIENRHPLYTQDVGSSNLSSPTVLHMDLISIIISVVLYIVIPAIVFVMAVMLDTDES